MFCISRPRIKRLILVLPLVFVLAFFVIGCSNSTGNISGTSTTNNQTGTTTSSQSGSSNTTTTNTPSSGTTPQSGSSTDNATNVKNGDQQVQSLLQSLDNAQKDADNASNSSQQDTNQVP